MRIIYIPVTKKITEKNFKNYFKCFLYDIYIILKNFSFNRKVTKGTSGYIDAAIHSNSFVIELPYNYCLFFSKILNLFFDGFFINWKFTNYRKDKDAIEAKLIISDVEVLRGAISIGRPRPINSGPITLALLIDLIIL